MFAVLFVGVPAPMAMHMAAAVMLAPTSVDRNHRMQERQVGCRPTAGYVMSAKNDGGST